MTPQPTPKKLLEIAKKVRRHTIDMAYRSKAGELGSALSISDILVVLYFCTLKVNPKKPLDPERDWFILSKGHGAASLYATLAMRGFFSEEKLMGYRAGKEGTFHCHPCSFTAPGIEVSTGSLGHGLSIAAGVALALRQKKNKIFVLVGDGECNEGSVWEAAMFGSTHNLKNLVTIIDNNKFQGYGETSKVHTMDLEKKWTSFGWKVLRVNGHDLAGMKKVFNEARKSTKPTVIIADTVSGKGVPHIENTLLAHYHVLNEKTYSESLHHHEK